MHNFVDLGTGKLMFDSQGNAWVADNFMVGAQNQDAFYDFDGKINKMQGIIAAPSGDIWAIDTMNSQVVHFPKGDTSKGEILCHNPSWDPLANPCKLLIPFAVAVDQKGDIWVTNFLADHVTRFPGGDVTKPETFKTGFSSSGLVVDSLGNIWITNKLGSSEWGRLKLLEMVAAGKVNYDGDRDASGRITRLLVPAMVDQKSGWEGGSLTVLHPDGSEAAFSPVYGKGIYGLWAVSVDGNDNIWVSNFTSSQAGIVQLCGFRTENCAPGMKTGDAISPAGGYVGGGLQLQRQTARDVKRRELIADASDISFSRQFEVRRCSVIRLVALIDERLYHIAVHPESTVDLFHEQRACPSKILASALTEEVSIAAKLLLRADAFQKVRPARRQSDLHQPVDQRKLNAGFWFASQCGPVTYSRRRASGYRTQFVARL